MPVRSGFEEELGSRCARRPAVRTAAAAWVAIGFAVVATAAAGDTLTQDVADRVVDEVATEVAAIRRLEFRRPVPVEVVDDRATERHVRERLFRFQDAEEIANESRALRILGLLPPGADLLQAVLDVMEEQAGGFYDPESGKFFLLDDMPARAAGVLASHELAHALEDQHFDLDGRFAKAVGDGDRLFAVGAVHEGSATLVMTVWATRAAMSGRLDAAALRDLERIVALGEQGVSEIPPFLARQLFGMYLLGARFLVRGEPGRLIGHGYPVDDVDRAYRAGPASSEQILHPEKYWEPELRDDPREVRLGRAGRSLGRGWGRAASGALGELGLATLFSETVPVAADATGFTDPAGWTDPAAAGWGGDRWELWLRGDDAVVLLKTVWDTADDAVEFAEATDGREGWSVRRSGSTVAVVAGDVAEVPVDKVLDRLAR